MVRGIGALCALTLAFCTLVNSAFGAPLPIEAFVRLESGVTSVDLAPDGKHLAMAIRRGQHSYIVVREVATGADKVLMAFDDPHARYSGVRWKSASRLFASAVFYRDLVNETDKTQVIRTAIEARLIGMELDGTNQITVHPSNPERGVLYHFSLINMLHKDPDHIAVRQGETIYKADIHTGQVEALDWGGPHVLGWDFNASGEPVLRTEAHGAIAVEARKPGTSDWTEVARITPRDDQLFQDLEILGPTENPLEFFVAVTPKTAADGQFRNVHLFNLATRTIGPPIWEAPKFDIQSIVYDGHTDRLIGVCYVVDVLTCESKNAAWTKDRAALSRFFEGSRNVRIHAQTEDGSIWLLSVSGPDEPRSYYLFDRKTKHVDLVVNAEPELTPSELAETKRVDYHARDGVLIPAYLTRPARASAGPMPLIVMPHGGPESRDALDFDLLSQFLASRGYLVLQPNFRGSAGFGLDFRNSGRKEWGFKMQDDITDGVNALIASGTADPKRICIVGGSYGGYAALIGGALAPDLYKCVVSIAGVSDLMEMLDYEKRGNRLAFEYWSEVIGDPAKDRARIEAASPLHHAVGYKPPVLLLHGNADTTVPPLQSVMMEEALKRAGRPVKRVSFLGAHTISSWPDFSKTKVLSEIEAFLAENLGTDAPAAASKAAH